MDEAIDPSRIRPASIDRKSGKTKAAVMYCRLPGLLTQAARWRRGPVAPRAGSGTPAGVPGKEYAEEGGGFFLRVHEGTPKRHGLRAAALRRGSRAFPSAGFSPCRSPWWRRQYCPASSGKPKITSNHKITRTTSHSSLRNLHWPNEARLRVLFQRRFRPRFVAGMVALVLQNIGPTRPPSINSLRISSSDQWASLCPLQKPLFLGR